MADGYHHGDLRSVVLRHAADQIAQDGVDGLSLRGLAQRSGVSHAAPAHHFGDANGLLTALAAEGFVRFVETQRAHEAAAPPGQPDRLVAAGLGYIAFATGHPALFRLMFASRRPHFADPALQAAARAAYEHLLENIAEVRGIADPASDPAALTDATAMWGIVHGLAELMQAGRAGFLLGLPEGERQGVLAGIIRRGLPG